MRAILALALVAVIAFAAGASGIASRLLHNPGANVTAAPTTTPSDNSTPVTVTTTTPATATAAVTAAVATTVSGTASSPTPAGTATRTAVAGPGAPLSLAQVRPGGSALSTGGWANGAGLIAQVMAPPTKGGLRAEVEARPLGQGFKGSPTGLALVQGGVVEVALHGLPAGRYHWQARLAADSGTGPWASYAHGATAFAVQLAAPVAPDVSSPTNPQRGVSYATPRMTFRWSAPDDPAGIAGYGYRLDTDPLGVARKGVRTTAREVALGGLGTGSYYFHVRALDAAGNWGDGATYPVRVDVTPPVLKQAIFSGYYVDPALENLTLDYKVSKVSTVTVGIYDSNGARVRHLVLSGLKLPGIAQQVSWDGRDDKGQLVPAGSYAVAMRATDRLGNASVVGDWGGFHVTYRRIVVSLSQQRLFAYDGPAPFLSTLVTTGNKELPTPTGVFHVMFSKSPFTFHSPWPKGSKYYYEPATANYALYFKDSGYFIHDAPWRAAFGPGTNNIMGTPGQNYTGTHGCVNVPEDAMKQLYAWATPGTPVQITN